MRSTLLLVLALLAANANAKGRIFWKICSRYLGNQVRGRGLWFMWEIVCFCCFSLPLTPLPPCQKPQSRMEEGKGVVFHYRLLPLFFFHVRTHCVFPPIELEPDEENDVIYLLYNGMERREGGGCLLEIHSPWQWMREAENHTLIFLYMWKNEILFCPFLGQKSDKFLTPQPATTTTSPTTAQKILS